MFALWQRGFRPDRRVQCHRRDQRDSPIQIEKSRKKTNGRNILFACPRCGLNPPVVEGGEKGLLELWETFVVLNIFVVEEISTVTSIEVPNEIVLLVRRDKCNRRTPLYVLELV